MTLIKFLLLDCALLVIGLPFVIALKTNKEQSNIDRKVNLNEIETMNSFNLPRLKELLELEVQAKKRGSGPQWPGRRWAGCRPGRWRADTALIFWDYSNFYNENLRINIRQF